jgi:hypothetical protein
MRSPSSAFWTKVSGLFISLVLPVLGILLDLADTTGAGRTALGAVGRELQGEGLGTVPCEEKRAGNVLNIEYVVLVVWIYKRRIKIKSFPLVEKHGERSNVIPIRSLNAPLRRRNIM